MVYLYPSIFDKKRYNSNVARVFFSVFARATDCTSRGKKNPSGVFRIYFRKHVDCHTVEDFRCASRDEDKARKGLKAAKEQRGQSRERPRATAKSKTAPALPRPDPCLPMPTHASTKKQNFRVKGR